MRSSASRASLFAALALVLLSAPGAWAETCTLDSVSGLNFGPYDPFSFTPLTTAGSLRFSCDGADGPRISISRGLHGTFAARAMRNPGDNVPLQYNLYVDAACQQIWGDGTSGTLAPTGPPGMSRSLPVFGCVPARQNVAAGVFGDTVVVTFDF